MDVAAAAVPATAESAGLTRILAVWFVKDGDVHVGLTHPTPAATNLFKARFGAQTVVFRHGPVYAEMKVSRVPLSAFRKVHASMPTRGRLVNAASAGPAATAPTRLLDSQPYFGGDRIEYDYASGTKRIIVQCTVGAPARTSSGTAAMLTAGHCGPTGRTWDQGYYPGTGSTIYVSGTMGTDKATQWGNGRVDGELLEGATYGYSASIYTSTSGAVPLDGDGTKSSVCPDGSFTGYTCSAVVQSSNVCAAVMEGSTVYNVCHLDIADATHRVVRAGDSGGPVLDPLSNGDVALAGTICAGSNDGHEIYYSDVASIESILGVTIG